MKILICSRTTSHFHALNRSLSNTFFCAGYWKRSGSGDGGFSLDHLPPPLTQNPHLTSPHLTDGASLCQSFVPLGTCQFCGVQTQSHGVLPPEYFPVVFALVSCNVTSTAGKRMHGPRLTSVFDARQAVISRELGQWPRTCAPAAGPLVVPPVRTVTGPTTRVHGIRKALVRCSHVPGHTNLTKGGTAFLYSAGRAGSCVMSPFPNEPSVS